MVLVKKKCGLFLGIIFLVVLLFMGFFSVSAVMAEGEECEINGMIISYEEDFLLCKDLVWIKVSFEELEEFVDSDVEVDMDYLEMIREEQALREGLDSGFDDELGISSAEEDRIRGIIAEQREQLEKEKETAVASEREQREISEDYLKRIDILIYLVIALVILIGGLILSFFIHLLFRYRSIKEIKDILYREHKSKVKVHVKKDKNSKTE